MKYLYVLLGLSLLTIGCSKSESVATAPGSGAAKGPAEQGSGASKAPSGSQQLQGNVSIDGSSTVFPISESAASRFQKEYPNVNVTVGTSGTGGGFKRFSKGEIDISDASRPIKLEELEAAQAAGVSFIELPIAYDGLTIAVHPTNDWVDQLTIDELKKIFLSDSAAKSWKDVRPGWPDREIKIFSPGTDSGTFDYFVEVVAGKDGVLRDDMSTSEDDNVLVQGIIGSPGAIGFFGVAYYEENREKLKAVPIVNPATSKGVLPSAGSIESGEYAPFSRPLFIYVNAASLKRPEVRRFADFYLENAPALASSTGYVALPETVYARDKELLKGRKAGTHYIGGDGKGRTGPVTEVFTEANLAPAK
jgi:phosphate transport system substrate-binding protein